MQFSPADQQKRCHRACNAHKDQSEAQQLMQGRYYITPECQIDPNRKQCQNRPQACNCKRACTLNRDFDRTKSRAPYYRQHKQYQHIGNTNLSCFKFRHYDSTSRMALSTTRHAPAHAAGGGHFPVWYQTNGRINTGLVADRIVTSATLPVFNA